MGFFSSVANKAEQYNKDQHEKKLEPFLFEGESIEYVYPLKTDFAALTNKRLIFVDSKVFLKETGIVSIPYSKIEQIGIVKDPTWSLSDRVEITTRHDKHELDFLKDSLEFYKKLASYIC